MMKKWAYVFLSLLLISCSKGNEEWTGPYLELTLVTDDIMVTKAENYRADGDDKYRENLMTTVDFFFYPDGKTNEDATYHRRVTSNKKGSDVLRLEMTSEKINKYIFPSEGDQDVRACTVYAIVNYDGLEDLWDEEDIHPAGSSLPLLEERVVVSDFVEPDDYGQSSFVMIGRADLALRGRSQVVSAAGTIQLERLACKITVGLNVSEQVVNAGEVWEPMLGGIEVYLVNGVRNVSIGGEAPEPYYFSYNSHRVKYFDDNSNPLPNVNKVGNYYVSYPMYTYPQHWTYGSTIGNDREPYLKLIIPWKQKNGGQKQFYYKVVFPDDVREEYRCRFVNNNWYHINIDVGMLGAETDEATITVQDPRVQDPETEKPLKVWCYIVDWQDKNVVIKNASIGNARYLSVVKVIDSLYNISSKVSYSYVSSHPVIIRDLKVGRPYYGTKGANAYTLGGQVTVAGEDDIFPKGTRYLNYKMAYNEETGDGSFIYKKDDGTEKPPVVWFKNTGSAVEFTHVLNNDFTDPIFDYSPYTIQYTLVHSDIKDDTEYAKLQTIVQFPAIYLERTPNPDTMKGNKPQHWGYVYVNGEQLTEERFNNALAAAIQEGKDEETWKNANYWRVVTYHSGGTDMYLVHATVLPSDSDLVIGDPRVHKYVEIEDINPKATVGEVDYSVGYCSAPHVNKEGDNHTLTYYYPTEKGIRTKNMIAPAFRISTKLSGSYDSTFISEDQAIFRCAAFQENGFPAGRWRLPTLGEIVFAAQLSVNNVFEWQFSDNYWSANGVVNVNRNTGEVTEKPSETKAYVRCVYDSWYWGDDRVINEQDGNLPSIFKWGDAER